MLTSGVPFFRTSDVVSISKNKENEKAYISLELFEELSKKSGKIQKGDLLVTGGGTIGIPYLVKNDEPLYFKDADLLWMKSSGIIDGSFLYNFFISPKFREYLKSISHTGTISHFTIEQAPEDEQEIVERNACLANLGITAIWFEKEVFDYVESILRLRSVVNSGHQTFHAASRFS